MKRPTPLLWISFGLVSLTLSILLMSDLAVNLISDQAVQIFEYRQKYSEAVAVQYSLLAENGDSRSIQKALDLLVGRNDDILSVALLVGNQEIFAKAGPHHDIWDQPPGDSSTPDHIQVPIFNGAERWGTVQIRFRSIDGGDWWALKDDPWVRFLVLVVGSAFLGYFLYPGWTRSSN